MKNKEDPDPRKLIPVLLFFITLLFYSFSCSEKVRLFIHVVEDGGSDGIPFASLLCISENGDSSFNYSDMEGNAMFLLPPGQVKITASCVGYELKNSETKLTQPETHLKILLTAGVKLDEVVILEHVAPLIDRGSAASIRTVTSEEIKPEPSRSVSSIASKTSGVYVKTVEASDLDIRGSRVDETSYFVDGIKVRYNSDLPARKRNIFEKKSKREDIIPEKKSIHDDFSIDNKLVRELGGKLSAGQINDFSKWSLWEKESFPELQGVAKNYNVETGTRYSFQVLDESGWPVPDVDVHLQEKGVDICVVHTDNTGRAECWSRRTDSIPENTLSVKVVTSSGEFSFNSIHAFRKGMNSLRIRHTCAVSDILDIAFLVDATGSMTDEINYLTAEMLDLVDAISRIDGRLKIRVASVFYRDNNCRFLVKSKDFTDAKNAIQFISAQSADEGGDLPEAMDTGLATLTSLSWSPVSRSRIAFLIADAPPHEYESSSVLLNRAIGESMRKGIRIVPVACSGTDKSTELLMRNIALLTNGTYVYLTDFSGIGESHSKPSTDKIDHAKLNSILKSVIRNFTRTFVCPANANEALSDSVEADKYLEEKLDETVKGFVHDADKDLNSKLVISPNPGPGYIVVRSNNVLKEIQIFDSYGKALQKFPADSKEVSLDLTNFPSGQYILIGIGKTKDSYGKLMINH